jgi:adenine-specific DNA-methyltransferase
MTQPTTPEDHTTLNDLLPTTPDGQAERIAALKQLFPDLFTNEGRLNPDELAQLVAPNDVHQSERYEFKWYGKAASKREAFIPTTATLVYDEARSVHPDQADGNMIIEGENLETLKLLLNAYREQVKCIYIDPPYNTGEDFIYRDDYKRNKANYWEDTGAAEKGIPLDTNPDTSGRFHSDWMSMMHSRILAARSLLHQDGVIFASCDDHELTNLKRIFDLVFGEENFVANFLWEKRTTRENRKVFSINHDYILCYATDKTHFTQRRNLLPTTEEVEARYSNPDNDPRGDWQSVSLNAQAGPGRRQEQFFTVTTPSGRQVNPPSGRCWIVTQSRLKELIDDNRIWFGLNGNNVPREKLFKTESNDGLVPHTLWQAREVGTTDTAKKHLISVFGGVEAFDTPKPIELLKRILQMTTNAEEGDLVLDFFAGSGSLAEAVLEQNMEDQGNRRCISIQIPELLPEDSPAKSINLHTLSSITIERVKRVIEGYGDKPQPIPDTGFKVYKLQKSNFPRCEFKPDPEATETENVAALRRYIDDKEGAFFLTLDENGEQAVFDEVCLKNGFQLHYTRTRCDDFSENTIYEVRDARRSALVCLEWNEAIQDATIKRLRELAETEDRPFFICLERALTTTTKWNLKHFLGNHFNAF